MVMRKSLLALVVGVLLSGSALAETAPAAIADKIKALLPGTEIASVETTPLDGVYEVTAGQNIFYMQPDKHFLLVGHLFDMKTTQDITQPKKDKLMAASLKMDWATIPTVGRVTVGDKDAKREVAAFLDVDCPYCKQAYQLLKDAKGFKVHFVMLPLDGLHPEARDKTVNILCADDQVAALGGAMAGLPTPKTSKGECATKAATELAEVAKFAAANNIQGTPYFVTNDGLVVPGMGEELLKWVKGIK